MPYLITVLVSAAILFSFVQEIKGQIKLSCREVVFNCDCGNPGYVFQAQFKQCHYWLPPEQACTKFQNCLECESGVDVCVSCPANRYGRRCRGVCQCKDGQTCNRDTGQCEGQGAVVPVLPPTSSPGVVPTSSPGVVPSSSPVSCIPPDVEPPLEQKLEKDRGFLKWIEYSCPEYFVLNGVRRITCNDGKWDNSPPICRARGCQRPEEIPNGRVDEFILPSGIRVGHRGSGDSQVFPVGTVAVYRCNAYYRISQRGQRTCLDTEVWSGEPRCLVNCGISEFSGKVPSIIGGSVTQLGNWPWQAALTNSTNHIFCGGSLITDKWVVTAGHCVTYKYTNTLLSTDMIKVFLGKYYRSTDDEHVQERSVNHFVLHPAYTSSTLDNDIALIALIVPVQLSSRVLPVCLTKESISFRNVEVGKSGVVTGWGITETGKPSDVLKRTSLTIISSSDCSKRHSEASNETFIVTVNMFCAGVPNGASDICSGDSGGPMMFDYETDEGIRWYLEGIVSWGSNLGCAKDGLYGGFTKVVNYLFWIYRYIDDLA